MEKRGVDCTHHWMIDTPDGPGGSCGICSSCGEVRLFSNAPVYATFLHHKNVRRREDVSDDDSFGDSETGSGNWNDATW